MATPIITNVTSDTPVSIKVTIQNTNRRLKLNFSDLSPSVLPNKLRSELGIPDNLVAVFERWSDSAARHVVLDPAEPSTYKSLLRAAKSKLKLRLRVTLPTLPEQSLLREQDNKPSPSLDVSALANALPSVPTLKPFMPAVTHKTTPFKFPHSAGVLLTDKPSPVSAMPPQPYKIDPIGSNPAASSSQRTLVAPQFPVHRFAPVVKPSSPTSAPAPAWSVYCNACDRPMEDEHYHCNTCDDGDYDLCRRCVDAGIHCQGASHWLIKRSIKNGQVVNSSTETLQLKNRSYPDLPGAFTEDKKVEEAEQHVEVDEEEASRTCNACVVALPEEEFVTCKDCEDYDLCISCHEENKHGHHPAHTFEPVSQDKTMSTMARYLLKAGRNSRHSALCDGCDKPIFGVRHKCLSCPDWDYCSDCFKSVKFIHKDHRFAPIYEPIAETRTLPVRHFGIYCDGHLCKGKKEYISGLRYKCAICHDTDFCGNCEASPGNVHNKSHPLIMFKTPIKNVSITTTNESDRGDILTTLGDRRRASLHVPSPRNAASDVQTIIDLKPVEVAAPPPLAVRPKPKIEIKDLLAEPIEEKIQVDDVLIPTKFASPKSINPDGGVSSSLRRVASYQPSELAAYYQRDTIRDGSLMTVGQQFTQVWTLVNPGPQVWPAGCSVRYVGGDNMLNVDNDQPSRMALVNKSMESNIIDRPVQVNEQVEFSVTMKAPTREGTAISYWRIKAPDGTPFGHRLWCHIRVTSPPAFAPATFPTTERTELVGRPTLHNQFMQVMMDHRNKQQEQQEAMRRAQAQQQMQLHSMRAEVPHQRSLQTQESKWDSIEAKLVKISEQAEAHADALRYVDRELQKLETSYMARARAASLAKEAADVAAATRAASVVSELSASTSTVAPSTSSTKPQPASVADAAEADSEGSQMIFPTLEKESPVASIHEADAKIVEAVDVSSPAATSSTLEFFEDAETIDVESSDDETFLTDDEYDILDASDEEHL